MIDASLNEVEGLAAKAARGAGLSWGLSEDTGRAARWLASHGIDWAAGLVALLDGRGRFAAPVLSTDGLLAALPPGSMSPLVAGSYLADLGDTAGEVRLGAIAHPVWLLPFAALSAADACLAVEVGWGGMIARLRAVGGDLSGDTAALSAPRAIEATWRITADVGPTIGAAKPLGRVDRSRVDRSAWSALAQLGAKTYVPASEQSRRTGAGAGLVDND